MSFTFLHEKIKTARKQYDCAASEWISNYGSLAEMMDDYKMPFSDRRKLAIMKKEKFKVLIGTKYLEQVGIYEGDFNCLQCRLDAVEICRKYGLFED
jgi:hypothetical protein